MFIADLWLLVTLFFIIILCRECNSDYDSPVCPRNKVIAQSLV